MASMDTVTTGVTLTLTRIGIIAVNHGTRVPNTPPTMTSGVTRVKPRNQNGNIAIIKLNV